MRTLGLTVLLAAALPAAAQDSPKAVIEKAIKAHGGADLLAKFTAQRVSGKGTIAIQGMDVDLVATTVTAFPGKRKTTGTLTVAGMELKIVQVMSGDTLSVTINGQALPLTDEQKTAERQELHADSLTRLVPLLKGDEYTLKAGEEAAVNGDPAVAVVVEHAKQKPVTLYFDKKTGLLAKLSLKGTDEGAEVLKETVYSDYKAVQGVQVPHKEASTKDGKKQAEFTVEKAELLEKADDSEFATD